jgi:hypothetical protein
MSFIKFDRSVTTKHVAVAAWRGDLVPDLQRNGRAPAAGARRASDGPLLREKVIDVPGRFSKSTLSLQVRAGRGNSITLGIENRDVITVVVRLVKYQLVTVIPMGAGGHVDLLNETWIRHRMVPPGNYLILQRCSPLPTRRSNKSLSQSGILGVIRPFNCGLLSSTSFGLNHRHGGSARPVGAGQGCGDTVPRFTLDQPIAPVSIGPNEM